MSEQLKHKNTIDRTERRARLPYIQKIRQYFPDARKILCVGARHVSEVIEFRKNGYEALGIDLYSSDESIVRIVDMHKLKTTFLQGEFDLIFSCHSLEHAYDPATVLRGFRHCATIGAFIVLPLAKEPNQKDPCVFNFMTNLVKAPDIKDIENELSAISCTKIEVKEMVYYPNPSDGLWLSIVWKAD
jgi:hypothetical protein